MDMIKTSAGLGSPGYTDDNAPEGNQWMKGVPPTHAKVPEGTKVEKTGKKNDYEPQYFCEVKLMDGIYKGELVWVKNTHVLEVVPPMEPPVEDMVPGKLYKVEYYVKLIEVKE